VPLLRGYDLVKSKPRYRILVVDDEPDITLTLKSGLEENGFQVFCYNNPFKALEQFKPNYFDLLLIDIRMPKMSGFKLYKEIMLIDPKAKICFITAFVTYHKYITENTNIHCFIKKPIMIEQLLEHIKPVLQNRRERGSNT
jgi:two-component system, OmpR family, response regulator ChvI